MDKLDPVIVKAIALVVMRRQPFTFTIPLGAEQHNVPYHIHMKKMQNRYYSRIFRVKQSLLKEAAINKNSDFKNYVDELSSLQIKRKTVGLTYTITIQLRFQEKLPLEPLENILRCIDEEEKFREEAQKRTNTLLEELGLMDTVENDTFFGG